MAKIQRNFRLEPDVDAALSKASSDSNPKTAIVDRALRLELGLAPLAAEAAALVAAYPELADPPSDDLIEAIRGILKSVDGTPADGNPPSESREPTDEDVRVWFTSLDGIDQQKIMVELGLDGVGKPGVGPDVTGQAATRPNDAVEPSFEEIVSQVEAAPEETRRAVLERLLGEQLKGPEPEGAQPSWATAPAGIAESQSPANDVDLSDKIGELDPRDPRHLTAAERTIAEEISAEQGLDMATAGRMARRIVQKRAEAAR